MSVAGPIPTDMSMHNCRINPRRTAGLLTRLRHSRRGNTLVIAAAAMIPLAGMVGGGLDLSRLYLTKTRLQHACDAGALAGRKAMGAGVWSQNNNQPRNTANQFFDGNIEGGSFGSINMQRAFTESAGKVTGRAQADVPMTLMKIFSKPTQTLAVTCDAEMRLPNTDVMFVLDTTGSMDDPQPGDSVSKMGALKTAVKCFYEIVARLDTNATCTTGVPSGGTGTQVQIRFGFVPYNSEVNVGRLLPTAWFADSWSYQSREPIFTDQTSSSKPAVTNSSVVNKDPRNWVTTNQGNVSADYCNRVAVPADTEFQRSGQESSPSEITSSGTNPRTTTWVTYTYGSYAEYRRTYDGTTCRIQMRQVFGDLRQVYAQTVTTTRTFSQWRYKQLPLDVRGLKNGTSWNASVDLPIGAGGTTASIPWDGCIEERPTVRTTNYNPISTGTGSSKAWDLDIDLVPTTSEPNSLWGPALHRAVFTRRGAFARDYNRDTIETTADYPQPTYYNCPSEAKLLQKWPDSSVANQPSFDTYVDGLTASGGTYHDIGMLWGARFLSPTGLFASTNATTPQGGEIERHLIFMTDGDTCTYDEMYAAYGAAWFDRRQTPDNTAPTTGCTDTGSLTQQVNLRTAAICTAVKNKNITLWVVAFGTLAPSTVTRLTACATPGRYFTATNAAQLQATFKSIADQISQLRLTS